MKYSYLLFISLFILLTPSRAQISYGGKPHFPQTEQQLRSFTHAAFFEMPSFDLDSILAEDALNESNMRGAYQFAHKFYTDIDKRRDAKLTVLADGTKVWTLTIHSPGAYSLNFLLGDVSLPEGGQLFIYNTDYSHVIGKFDRRSVSESRRLPIRPVSGETIIIEYSEPADAGFEGNFVVAEVNHDYRDFLRKEPGADHSDHACMTDVWCEDVDPALIRSTVLLMINGNTACTGSLIKSAEDELQTYVLTAVHCLNTSIQTVSQPLSFYEDRAGTIVAFFNYDRTICGSKMKGTEEMTIAWSYPVVIAEKKDAALLAFRDTPPTHFNAYYAGWNISGTGTDYPYHNLHHPEGVLKKYGYANKSISLTSLSMNPFDRNSHWLVSSWTSGATDNGSSGSPLFDKNGLIVGALTAGSSLCAGTNPNGKSDYFFSIAKAWEIENEMGQLKTFLDPESRGLSSYPGYDPHEANPITRLSNLIHQNEYLATSTLEAPNSGYVFGNSSLEVTEFAEAFYVEEEAELLGAYLLIPPMTSSLIDGLEVSVYKGINSPEELIGTYYVHPYYTKYSSSTGFGETIKTTASYGTENFVPFTDNLKIKGNIYISYKAPSSSNSFCIYNMEWDNDEDNTAWVKDTNVGWIPATSYPYFEKPASLGIIALVSENKESAIEAPEAEKSASLFYYDSTRSVLKIKSPISGTAHLKVYSITGQLIEEQHLIAGQNEYSLARIKKGSIGIIKAIINNNSYSMKIIY